MYIEHPYLYEGKYYAKVDNQFVEITKEVAYAMNNFYRSSLPKKVDIKDENGEIVERVSRFIIVMPTVTLLKAANTLLSVRIVVKMQ